MHETEFSIQEVEIEMQTLARFAPHHQLGAGPDTLHHERLAAFQDGKNTDQPRTEVVPGRNSPRQVFFGLTTALVVAVVKYSYGRPAAANCSTWALQFRRGLLNRATEILEQHAVRTQKARKCAAGKQAAQVAAEDDPVEHGQRAFNSVCVDFPKVVHDSSLRHDRGAGRAAAVQSSSDNRS